jgi:surface polysaccharide O-acyltransferase-like enzyme
MASEKRKGRIVYFDFLRALAPIAIILIHVIEEARPPEDRVDYVWAHSLVLLCRFAVPVFLMMSGALFLDPKRPFDMKTHFKKYVLRMALILVVWQIIYALGEALTMKAMPGGAGRLETFLTAMFSMKYKHLWYILMLLAMYLLVPILRRVTQDKKTTEYFLFIGIVVCFALPMLVNYAYMIMTSSIGGGRALTASLTGFTTFVDFFHSKMALDYMVFFVLGYYLSSVRLTLKQRRIIYVLGVAALAVAIIASPLRRALLGDDFDTRNVDAANINFFTLLYSVAVFVFARYTLASRKRTPKMISVMAKYSLGVYLIHFALVKFVFYRCLYLERLNIDNMCILVPVFAVLAYVGSFAASWILHRIPAVRRVV